VQRGVQRINGLVPRRVAGAVILRFAFGDAFRGKVITMNVDKELDTSGLSCPLPILKAKKVLNEMKSGQVLKVVATDPGSVKDFESFSRQTGHPLLSSTEEADTFVFLLKKK